MLRGFTLEGIRYPDIPVVATLHPSYVLHGKKPALHRVLADDIKRAVSVAAHGAPKPTDFSRCVEFPSIGDMKDLFTNHLSLFTGHISLDIETDFSPGVEDESQLLVAKDGAVILMSDAEERGEEELLMGVDGLELEPDSTRFDPAKTKITQIQFGWDNGRAVVLPFVPEFFPLIRQCLALPNEKVTWNGDVFDYPLLRNDGFPINGPHTDLMIAWGHWQPDYPKALQSVTSLLCPDARPWKHLHNSAPGMYGFCDVIYPDRMWTIIRDLLNKRGTLVDPDPPKGSLGRGFVAQRTAFRPVLDHMSNHGFPIDVESKNAFGDDITAQVEEYDRQAQEYAPLEICGLHPKGGYKTGKVPKKIPKWAEGRPVVWEDDRPSFVKPFNPGAEKQIKRYIQYKIDEQEKSGLPKSKQPWRMPKNVNDPLKDSTSVENLKRLQAAVERTLGEKDPLLQIVIDRTPLVKMNAAFVKGWKAGKDGRVHTTYKDTTATGQMAASNPNVLADPAHGKLAKRWLMVKRADPGHVFVSVDFSGYHAVTTGFEAKDPTYIRAARLDIHGILGYVVERLDGYQKLVDGLRDPRVMSDEEILERVKGWARKHVEGFKDRRDLQYKRVVLGNQFGMREHKVQRMYPESFPSVKDAKRIFDVERDVFKPVFVWQDEQRRKADTQKFLRTKYHYERWFWDVYRRVKRGNDWVQIPGEDSEKCIAYEPANDAFGHVRECLIFLHTTLHPHDGRRLSERYGLFNNVHDAPAFMVEVGLQDELFAVLERLLQRRNHVLVNEAAPDGLYFGVEAARSLPEKGNHWLSLKSGLASLEDTLPSTLNNIPMKPGPFEVDLTKGWAGLGI
jgi:hypothetical protein